MWTENQLRTLFDKIDVLRSEMVEAQKKLVAIPAISPLNGGKGEADKAKVILSMLKEIGLDEIREFNAPATDVPAGYRPNICARLKGRTSDRTTWIMTHMDVVPPGDHELWKTPPFEAVEKDGKIYGRGTEDNHQGILSAIFAVKALRECRLTPPQDVGLVFAADEETGNTFGIQYVLENHNPFKKQDIIIVPDGGNPDGSMIEVAEKSILWLRFTVEGKQCHASMPALGVNAARAAAVLTTRLDQTFHSKFSDSDPVFRPSESTFEPTLREPNVQNINTIPGKDVLCFDCRVLPHYRLEDVVETARKVAADVSEEFRVKISVDPVQFAQAAPPTPNDAEVVNLLIPAIKRVYGVDARPMGIGGGTVAAAFRRMGYHTAVWARLDETCHQPNEYCVIDNLAGDAKVFAFVFGCSSSH